MEVGRAKIGWQGCPKGIGEGSKGFGRGQKRLGKRSEMGRRVVRGIEGDSQ